MKARSVLAAVVLMSALVMSGCGGQPAPVETTPAFASEEEAFAAAEETYRAYVDALNQVDLSDPATFEPVFALTTGEANAGLRKSFSQMHADGWAVHGESVATVVEPSSVDGDVAELAICLDVTEVTVTDSEGVSMVEPNRVDVQSMSIEVLTEADHASPVIRAFNGREGAPTCAG